MKSNGVRTSKKQPSERTLKARAFCKRYWYWFVTIAALVVIVIGWCYFMGYFEKKKEVVRLNEELYIFPGAYYVLDVDVSRKDVEVKPLDEKNENVLVKDNVLYAHKNGNAYIYVKNGEVETMYYVTVSPVEMEWTIATGEIIEEDEMRSVAENLYRGSLSYYMNNDDVFGYESDGLFLARSEGECQIAYFVDDVYVCDLFVTVKDDLAPEERVVTDSIAFLGEDGERELASGLKGKTRREITLKLGDTYTVDDFAFSGGGNVFFRSSSEQVLAYQNGVLYGYAPGTATVAVVCATPTGMDYYAIKVTVPVLDVDMQKPDEDGDGWRPIYVGETVTEEELIGAQNHENLSDFESESSALERIANDPYEFKAIRATENATINAYMQTKKGRYLIIRYHVTIVEEGSEVQQNDE